MFLPIPNPLPGGNTHMITGQNIDPKKSAMGSVFYLGTAHSSKERRRPLFWRPFWTVTQPAPGLLAPLSGFLASRRREQRKNGEKSVKNGRDTAI